MMHKPMKRPPQTASSTFRPTSAAQQSFGNISTQAQSVAFEGDFSQRHEEGAQSSIPFKSFYTSGEEVKHGMSANRFEGRSNYFHYYPTGNRVEQKLEKIWFDNRNKELQEKREGEEMKKTVRNWSEARSRIESEIQRKKEALRKGTIF
jgi:hypothetical protein